MSSETILIELFTEELPPRALLGLAQSFAAGVAKSLRSQNFLTESSVISHFATPRRLAVSITAVLKRSPDRSTREKLLPLSVALDAAGEPSVPLKKKMAAMGLVHVAVGELERAADGKGESFFYTRIVPGVGIDVGAAAALTEAVARLPLPKSMSYQLHAGTPEELTVQFVRPARRLVALYGRQVLPLSVLGLLAGATTEGHRFLCAAPIEISGADEYEAILHEQGRVVASLEGRRLAIEEGLTRAAGPDAVLAPAALLDEVAALTEWPVVLEGFFEERFLTIPQECLILTMQRNQRYFALTDDQGKMQHRFLLVSNIEATDSTAIIAGNERVLRARLADAEFFYQQDRKRTLASRVKELAHVVYHQKLGSQLERVLRIEALTGLLCTQLNADPATSSRAARLAKADLTSEMVGEFPELQGVMGRYYALFDGEDVAVAQAIEEHYYPRFAGDLVPASSIGAGVALADKLEVLVGMFGIGLAPTGERDPYALRRAALGVLRILIEKRLPLELTPLVDAAFATFQGVAGLADIRAELQGFMFERLRGYFRDQGYTSAEIEAVLNPAPERIDLIAERLRAVRSFATLPEAQSLAAANKRIGNILKKANATHYALDPARLSDAAEKALAAALLALRPGAEALYEKRDYAGMLRSLASLRGPVDAFFTDVIVMAEDAAVRANRLALLCELHTLMNRVADLSKLVVDAR